MPLWAEPWVRQVEGGLWAAGSLLGYLAVVYLVWLGRRWLAGSDKVRWLFPCARAGRWALWIGLPYLALGGWPMRTGAVPASALGWVGFTWSWRMWMEVAGRAIPIGLLVLLGLALGRLYVASAYRARGSRPASPGSPPFLPWWEHLVEAMVLDVHWAFYWATMAVVSSDRYTGVWLGLGLIYLELALQPFWRRDLSRPRRSSIGWEEPALALGLALVFLQTGSLWMCMGVHGILALLLNRPSAQLRQAAIAAE